MPCPIFSYSIVHSQQEDYLIDAKEGGVSVQYMYIDSDACCTVLLRGGGAPPHVCPAVCFFLNLFVRLHPVFVRFFDRRSQYMAIYYIILYKLSLLSL